MKIILVISLSIGVLFAEDIHFKSSENKTILVELYSSEGCSSCPSAEKWLNHFENNPDLFTKVIPLAFHVSYWNHIGWKDTFSQSSFDDRQRHYRDTGNVSSVYTPQFVIDSQEWRGWFEGKSMPTTTTQKSGILKVSINNNTATIDYSKTNKTYIVHSALLGFGLTSNIQSGENGGKILQHDFIVLKHKSESFKNGHAISNKLNSTVPTKRLAYVVWLSETNSETIIQATGGWLN